VKARATLEEFDATRRTARECWICNIPERETIDAQWRKDQVVRKRAVNRRLGVSTRRMIEWLIDEHGYSPDEATHPKLKNHFDRRHHEGGAHGKAQERKA
jgi:hypothetical protein